MLRTLEQLIAHDVLSDGQSETLLLAELLQIERQLYQKWSWLDTLTEPRRAVLVDMVFAIGVDSLMSFRRMLGAIQNGHFDMAAEELLHSAWAKKMPERAGQLAQQLKTDRWQHASSADTPKKLALLSEKNVALFCEQLKGHEGVKCAAYFDTASPPVLTIGVGHNCVAAPVAGVCKKGDIITKKKVLALLAADIAIAEQALLKHLPWIVTLSEPRRAVLLNMTFNLGIAGLLTFHNTLRAMQEGRFHDAVHEMRSSKWYGQVGDRARELITQFEEDRWLSR